MRIILLTCASLGTLWAQAQLPSLPRLPQIATANYRIEYLLSYSPDSTDIKYQQTETFFLLVQAKGESAFASQNFFKRDSLRSLIRQGILSGLEVVSNPQNRFRTNFNQFVHKVYVPFSTQIYETISVQQVIYSLDSLRWVISDQVSQKLGYMCRKATTEYAGRQYEAWFSSEFAIPDGPYIFSGLPGLIVCLQDRRGHYRFSLRSIQPYESVVPQQPTYNATKGPLQISPFQVVQMRQENQADPIGYLEKVTGHSMAGATFTPNGSTTSIPIREAVKKRRYNNPLELKVKSSIGAF